MTKFSRLLFPRFASHFHSNGTGFLTDTALKLQNSLFLLCAFLCYLNIWPFMHHPWFPTRKSSKLTFVCFQLLLFSPCNVFNNWSWKQKNVSFEDFLVGNQGWCIKGQMLRKFIWYPKSIFRFIRPSIVSQNG